MTRGIDNSELIDRFLRDEMRGEERDVFLRRMETDPAFRLEVESQKLLAEAIRLARKNELKRYIAEQTKTKTARLRPVFVWSISAAASVAAIAVFWFSLQRYNDTSERKLAKEPVKQQSLPQTNPEMPASEPNRTDRMIAVAPPPPPPVAAQEWQQDNIDNEEDMNRSEAPTQAAGEINTAAAEPVAPESSASSYEVATIKVAVADFNATGKEQGQALSQEVVVTTKRLKTTAKVERSGNTEPALREEKESQDDASGSRSGALVKRDVAQISYTLVFINSRDGVKKAVPEKGNRIQVFNLPFSNPMLIALGGKYYLSTAGQFYQLIPDALTSQNLTPVKDAALLKQLQGE
jgi:hypothetical protein